MYHATRNALLALLLALGLLAQAQTLVSVVQKGSIPQSIADLALGQFGLSALNDIDYYVVRYTMENFEGGVDTVSGLMVRPAGASFRYPTAVYFHGTTNDKYGVPSRAQPGQDLPYLIATQGYVAIAPDFLNMGDDPDGFHPYVHGRSEALSALRMMQALAAAPEYADAVNEQHFITGYSQGGHASMAFHKLLIEEYPNIEVTAAAHMSGPYSVSQVMKDSVILRDKSFQYFAFLPYTVLGYQAVYPELRRPLGTIFKAPYVPIITAFRDGYPTGAVTLERLTDSLLTIYAKTEGNQNFYPSRLLLPVFADSLRASALDPNASDFLKRLRENDTYTFTNPTPTRLLYCTADDQVSFRNSLLAQDSMRARGATDTEAIDVNPAASHRGCVQPAVTAMIRFFAEYRTIVSGVAIPESVDWTWRQDGGGLVVDTRDDAQYQIVLFDAAGRTLINRAYRSGEYLSLDGVPRGFALVRLMDQQGRSVGRPIVVR